MKKFTNIFEGKDNIHVNESINFNLKAELSGKPNDMNGFLAAGYADGFGEFGIIFGEPFKYGDAAGCARAERIVSDCGISIGNDYDMWVGEMEREYDSVELKKTYFCYFKANAIDNTADCYVFGDSGVGGGVFLVK